MRDTQAILHCKIEGTHDQETLAKRKTPEGDK